MIYQFHALLALVSVIALSACAPKVQSAITNQRPALASHESVVILEKGAGAAPEGIEKVGAIAIGDGGLTLDCEYFFVAALAKEEARRAGGNLVFITEHKRPDAWSSCHRITADVYYTPDISAYETEVTWNEKRALQSRDFKGPADSRPFMAATVSGIKIEAVTLAGLPPRLKASIESVFDSRKSYIADTANLAYTLQHEQLHFDITEWHARKLRQKVKEEIHSLNDWNAKMEQLFGQANEELFRAQDQYDSEVYANAEKQEAWVEKVRSELDALEAHKQPVFIIAGKKK